MTSKQFAVFDIDGTLIRWQLYHAVVDRLAKKGFLDKDSKDKIHEARMKWKNREHDEAFHSYEDVLIKVYEKALPELSTTVFDEIAEEVASEYKTQVYTYTRDLAKKLKIQGYKLVAISGSHEELLGHVVKQYDFDIWVGTKYERTNGSFSGKKFVASFDKKKVLEGLIKSNDLTIKDSWGVGDSKSDAAFLEMVDNPIAFNPDKNLFKVARQNNWPIVVERKNVVYELQKDDKGYSLK